MKAKIVIPLLLRLAKMTEYVSFLIEPFPHDIKEVPGNFSHHSVNDRYFDLWAAPDGSPPKHQKQRQDLFSLHNVQHYP